MTLDYLISIGKIILFDLVLSGDNAVVIGLAAHRLPPVQRKQAMFWGCGLAIVMRIILTLIVSLLLAMPGLRFIGALLLAWIACKLMLEEVRAAGDPNIAPTSLFKAIQRIAMADFIMSLDNVLAIASASDSDWKRILFGLVVSISMLLALSAVITEINKGLDKIITDFGAEWRFAGCSMCLGMNPDQLAPGERCASTSNRNFEGRQGKGGRTHLVSPLVAAATAIRGTLSSPSDLEV